jgi:hypothetical protein
MRTVVTQKIVLVRLGHGTKISFGATSQGFEAVLGLTDL